MKRSFFVRFKSLAIFCVAVAVASIAACSENLDSGGSCPLLCPGESAPLLDTIVDAVVVDADEGQGVDQEVVQAFAEADPACEDRDNPDQRRRRADRPDVLAVRALQARHPAGDVTGERPMSGVR